MVSKELVKYAKEHFGLGMSADDIRIELLKQGRSAADIDSAIIEAGDASEAEEKKPQRQGPSAVTKVFVVLTMLAAVAIIIFFVIAKMKAPAEIPPAPEVSPPAEEAPVQEEETTLPVPPEEVKEEIPEEEPETAKPEPSPVVAGREVPEYNLSRLEFGLTERLEYIRDISMKNPDASIAMCSDYIRASERDICFVAIARAIPDFMQCGRIAEQALRDQCYLAFAVTGVNTCDKVNDSDVKETCDKLIQLNLTRAMP